MSTSRIILDSFSAITDEDAYANLALKALQGKISDERDMRFARALIYNVLEHLSYIDYMIAHFAKGKQNKVIKNILRLGTCQILYMKRPQSAVCNECVKLTREIGKSALSGYVNGVLRSICRAVEANALPKLPDNDEQRLIIETGYPKWLVHEYIDRFGADEARAILTAKDDRITVRVQFPYTPQAFQNWCTENNIGCVVSDFDENLFKLKATTSIVDTELFSSGNITVQGESSSLVCRACNARKGMKILDACAAPGGKSAYLAALLEYQCEITACELHEHRAKLMQNTFDRLHIKCADVKIMDMTEYNAHFAEKFDLVLCDVPCSGLGVLSKPDVRYKKDASSVDDIAKIQKAIINNCARYIKIGGTLVYSTCTVSLRENENIIFSFLKENKGFELDTGLKNSLPDFLTAEAEKGYVHLLPSRYKIDGFFIARLIRRK